MDACTGLVPYNFRFHVLHNFHYECLHQYMLLRDKSLIKVPTFVFLNNVSAASGTVLSGYLIILIIILSLHLIYENTDSYLHTVLKAFIL
jgi:hypothetical protein